LCGIAANEVKPPAMKLHITPGSPYARMARIVVLEKGLADKVEVVLAKTRTPESPYYAVNPSGRVPFLELGDGTGFEDSPLICHYLDALGGKPALHPANGPEGLEMRRIEAMARSLLDGLSVWGREIIYRPEPMRSQPILAHEAARALRMAEAFERELSNPVLAGPLNIAQITLGCALDGPNAPKLCGQEWRSARPKLAAWTEKIAARPSFMATKPPPPKAH
jgi:glutathione S-transferase